MTTVKGVTLDNGQWVTFMNPVALGWVDQYILSAYPGRTIEDIRYGEDDIKYETSDLCCRCHRRPIFDISDGLCAQCCFDVMAEQ